MSKLFSRSSFARLAMVGLLAGASAQAAPVGTLAEIDFTGGAASFGYLGSQFTLTDVSGGAFTFDSVAVSTESGAAVTSQSIFGPTVPTSYFDPIRGSGHLVFDASYQYSGFDLAVISASALPTFIGLALTLDDGVHYGYARFAGTYLVSYAFESIAGAGIDAAGADAIAAIPEPETVALMLAGFAAMGAALRRRRSGAASNAALVISAA